MADFDDENDFMRLKKKSSEYPIGAMKPPLSKNCWIGTIWSGASTHGASFVVYRFWNCPNEPD